MKRIAPVLLSLALILLCLPTLSANQGTYTVGEGGQYPTFEALQTALESTVDLPSAITIELTSDIEGSLILKSNLPSNLTSLTIDGQGYTIITSSPDVSISNNPGSPIQNITVKDLSLRNDDSFYSAQSITLTFEGNCFIQSNFSSVGIARATVVVAKGARLTTCLLYTSRCV